MKRKLFITLLLSCLNAGLLLAQDPYFTQAYANPLYLNPAFAGTSPTQRIDLNTRIEWPNIPGTFVTYNASYDRNVFDSSTGIGVLANRDYAGQNTLITTNASLILAKQIHFAKFTVSVGMQFTYREVDVDWSKLTYGDMIDPTRGFVYNTSETATRNKIGEPDFSGGLLGYGKNYFIGLSFSHLTQPDESFTTGASPLPLKFTFNTGYVIKTGLLNITPSIIYVSQQDFSTTVVECYLNKGKVTLGLGYSVGNALVGTLGFRNKFMSIGFSYDYTTSALTEQTGGTYEGSLAILLQYHSAKLQKKTGVNIPNF